MARDKKAGQLDAQGLWRRVAAGWPEVMNEAQSDPQQERIARRRVGMPS